MTKLGVRIRHCPSISLASASSLFFPSFYIILSHSFTFTFFTYFNSQHNLAFLLVFARRCCESTPPLHCRYPFFIMPYVYTLIWIHFLYTRYISLYTTRSQHNLVLVFGAIATTPLQVAAKSTKYRMIAFARRAAVQSWWIFISEFVQHHYSDFSSQTPETVLMQFGDGAWFLLHVNKKSSSGKLKCSY